MIADHKDIVELQREINRLKGLVNELEGIVLAHNTSIKELYDTKQNRKGPKSGQAKKTERHRATIDL